LAFEIPFFGYG